MLIPNAVAFVCFFSSEIWSELAISLRDSTLRELATTSLPSLLMSAKASSTTKKYLANWARWESWASSKIDVPVFPVDPIHFSLYIAHLATTGPKTIAESVAAAVKWVHSLTALPSPTDNMMVKTAMQGFKIMTSHGHPNATLADLRVLFVCFVSYAGFLRFNDLSGVMRKDCVIKSDRLTISPDPSRNRTLFRRTGRSCRISSACASQTCSYQKGS